MGLEHRWSMRKQVCLNAVAFHGSAGLLPVKILNIGLEGAFIAADRLDLPVPSIIEMVFGFENGDRKSVYHTDAMVIHQSNGGYGVMFKEFKLEAFRSLMDMLYAA